MTVMYPPAILSRLNALEQKGIVRRVRTEAGAKLYGQPIGSIIVVDKNIISRKKPKAKKKTPKVPKVSVAPNKPTQVNDQSPNGQWLAENFKNFVPTNAQHRAAMKELDRQNFWMGGKYSKDSDWGSNAWGGSIAVNYSLGQVNAVYKDAATNDWKFFKEDIADFGNRADAHEYVVGRAAHYYVAKQKRLTKHSNKEDEYGLRSRNEKKRDYEGFMDYMSGVRGRDWSVEGDPEPVNEETRNDLADQEAEELGIQFAYTDSADRYSLDFDVNAKEMVNATVRAYEDMYPGFSQYVVSDYTLDFRDGMIAYNAFPMYGGEGMMQRTLIGLPDAFWGKGNITNMSGQNGGRWNRNAPAQRKALDTQRFAEEHDMEPWQAQGYQTLNHELGHSIGFMLFNMQGDGSDFMSAVEARNNPDDPTLSVGNEFRSEMVGIMEKYGIFGDKIDIDNYDTINRAFMHYDNNNESFDRTLPGTLNHAVLTEHLSNYGAGNFHELMAETWMAYQMHPAPGDFVREMGALMEAALTSFLDRSREMYED